MAEGAILCETNQCDLMDKGELRWHPNFRNCEHVTLHKNNKCEPVSLERKSVAEEPEHAYSDVSLFYTV